jgi:TrkA domain protein
MYRHNQEVAMDIIRNTVPGVGVMHDATTRDGQQFRLLVEDSTISLFIYGDADEPATTVVFDREEADQVANLLHSKPIPDRMADLERRFAEIVGRAR